MQSPKQPFSFQYVAAVACALIFPMVGIGQSAGLNAATPSATGTVSPENVTLNPFQIDAETNVGYPHFVENHFFEKIDELDKHPWRHAKIGNIEVLSRCSDETTERFVTELRHRLQLMTPIGPQLPIASLDCPLRLFLYQYEAGWNAYPHKENGFGNLNGGREIVTLMVNLWAYEKLDKPKGDDASLLLTVDNAARGFVHAQFLAQLWSEPSARWLHRALDNFYGEVRLGSNSVTLVWPPTVAGRGPRGSVAQVTSWPKIDLLPMGSVFNPKEIAFDPKTGMPIRDDAYWLVWEAQLGLFMRWALLGDHQRRQDAFWKFAARARTQPNTESLFQECFGTSYRAVEAELAGYLQEGRAAVEFPTIVVPAGRSKNPPKLKDATPAEFEQFKNSVNDAFDHQGNA